MEGEAKLHKIAESSIMYLLLSPLPAIDHQRKMDVVEMNLNHAPGVNLLFTNLMGTKRQEPWRIA